MYICTNSKYIEINIIVVCGFDNEATINVALCKYVPLFGKISRVQNDKLVTNSCDH